MFRSYLGISLLTAFFAAAIVASGCGSGDDSEAALTKAQFIKQGDQICAKFQEEQLKGLREYAKEHPNAGQDDLVVFVGLPPINKAIEGLESLNPPPADEAEVETMITAMEDAVDKAEADPQAIVSGESNPFDKADRLAAEYGFKVCAEAP
jgi:hypothetical protein